MSAEYRGWWEPIKVPLLFPRGYLKLCVILTESVPRTDLNSLFYRILRTQMRESACRKQVYCLTKQQPKWLQFESKHQRLFKFLFASLFNTSKRLCCIIETKKPVWRAKSCNSVPKKKLNSLYYTICSNSFNLSKSKKLWLATPPGALQYCELVKSVKQVDSKKS